MYKRLDVKDTSFSNTYNQIKMSQESEQANDHGEVDGTKKRSRSSAFESLFEPQPNEENFPSKQRKGGRSESAWAPYINMIGGGKCKCLEENCTTILQLESINSKTKKPIKLWSSVKNHYRLMHNERYAKIVSGRKDDFTSPTSSQPFPINIPEQQPLSNRKIGLTPMEFHTFHCSYADACAALGFSKNLSQKPRFRRVFESIGCDITLPCPSTINNWHDRLTKCIKENQRNEVFSFIAEARKLLSNNACFPLISGQYDLYKSDLKCHQELLGAHITITNPNNLSTHRICLGIEEVNTSSSGVDISKIFQTLMINHGLLEKDDLNEMSNILYSITTDSASNMEKSVTDIGVINFRCLCHRLHLAVQDSLELKKTKLELDAFPTPNDIFLKLSGSNESLPHLLRHDMHNPPSFLLAICKLSIIGAYFSRSANASLKLRRFQQQRRKTISLPTVWNKTRWSGLYESLVTHYNAIQNGLSEFLQLNLDDLQENVAEGMRIDKNHEQVVLELLSVLQGVFDLTKKLQKPSLSIGEGYMHCVFTCLELFADFVTCYQSSELLQVGAMDSSVVQFRRNLLQNICSRIIHNLEDEILFSIFSNAELLSRFEYACSEVEKKDGGSQIFWNYTHNDIGYFESSKCRFISFTTRFIPRFTASASIVNENQIDQTQKKEVVYNIEGGYQSYRVAKKKKNASSSNAGLSPKELSKLFLDTISQSQETEDVFWLMHRGKFAPIFMKLLQNRSISASSSDTESLFSKVSHAIPADRRSTDIESLVNMVKIKSYDVSNELITKCVKNHIDKQSQNTQNAQSSNENNSTIV